MHAANLVEQMHVRFGSPAERPLPPRIKATRTDAEESTQAPYRVRALLVLDEGESFARRSEVNAIAFFKRSCSTLSCS